MSKTKERFNPTEFSFQDVLGDVSLFDSYYGFIYDEYLKKITQSDVKTPQAWIFDELKRDLYFSDLTPQAQEIFDDLTTGELTDIRKSYRIFEITATEKQVEAMSVEQLREVALNRTAVGLAAKIYLARFIDEKNLRGALKYRGDIGSSYWNEVGDSYTLVYIARTGFDRWKTPHDFAHALENHILYIQTENY